MIKRKYEVEKTSFPIDGVYNYSARVLISIDGGENYYYCGIGKFCKTEEEASEWCKRYAEEHGG